MDLLYAGIDDAVLVLKEGREMTTANIAIFVNCGGQDHPTIILVPNRVIGSAAENEMRNGVRVMIIMR